MPPASAGALHGLVGQSPQMCRVRRLVEKLARNRAPVLILGETGTGKEIVARAIHDLNPRGQFVTVDCGSLSSTLIESELFGHARGAFTGAATDRLGLIDAANGGTVFFDEVGELPLEMQTRLLRVLQEGEIRPVGSLRPRKVDVRVIAATNRNLEREVAAGRFRADLFYRLNVVVITLPPLRERRDDILPLAEHFLECAGGFRLDAGARQALLGYDWPGNVRELENAIKGLAAIVSGSTLDLGDLPSPIQKYLSTDLERLAAALDREDESALPVEVSRRPPLPLAAAKREHILRALASTGGDRTRTAEILGISRTTLYRKLKEYGIGT